ncbi:RNA-binding RRM/RBD/RNP motifs family protein with retrovirus zinc finger-like domain [Prunus dulcis]|uniref:RNA-binding RRM/RBD/RNP motifs family protein with retrovirus zinc finger-like domain n=1 Tax=Prunus dulcis TaxID=3755 RepID=A0A4Y1R0Z9_PRUDU|nr:RNA-binding RRM/RBD/RNP motifs family protein with retrovirus zinc finger-like domain [Prunus dulcis]
MGVLTTLQPVIHSNKEKIMMEEIQSSSGFGFITFGDRRAMEDAIREMHGRELGDRIISVNKAQPKMGGGGEDSDHGYRGGYSTGGRRNYGEEIDLTLGPRLPFSWWWKRWRFILIHSRFGTGGRGDRFGGDRDRYVDDRYDGGRYGERDRFDSREDKYGSRDRYVSDRYPAGDRFASDRYGGSDRYPQNGYGKDRGYDRDARGGSDRYGSGGPARDEGGNYRSRAGPYDRPSRGGRPSSFDRY